MLDRRRLRKVALLQRRPGLEMRGLPSPPEKCYEYYSKEYHRQLSKGDPRLIGAPQENGVTLPCDEKKPARGRARRWFRNYCMRMLHCWLMPLTLFMYWGSFQCMQELTLRQPRGFPPVDLSKYSSGDLNMFRPRQSLPEIFQNGLPEIFQNASFNYKSCNQERRSFEDCVNECNKRSPKHKCPEEEIKRLRKKTMVSADCKEARRIVDTYSEVFKLQLRTFMIDSICSSETMARTAAAIAVHAMLHLRSSAALQKFMVCVILAGIAVGLTQSFGFPVSTILASQSLGQFVFGVLTRFERVNPKASLVLMLANIAFFVVRAFHWEKKLEQGIDNKISWAAPMDIVAYAVQDMEGRAYLLGLLSSKALQERFCDLLGSLFDVGSCMWIFFWWAARYVLHDWISACMMYTADIGEVQQVQDYEIDRLLWLARTAISLSLSWVPYFFNYPWERNKKKYDFVPCLWDVYIVVCTLASCFTFSWFMHKAENFIINAIFIGLIHHGSPSLH